MAGERFPLGLCGSFRALLVMIFYDGFLELGDLTCLRLP